MLRADVCTWGIQLVEEQSHSCAEGFSPVTRLTTSGTPLAPELMHLSLPRFLPATLRHAIGFPSPDGRGALFLRGDTAFLIMRTAQSLRIMLSGTSIHCACHMLNRTSHRPESNAMMSTLSTPAHLWPHSPFHAPCVVCTASNN